MKTNLPTPLSEAEIEGRLDRLAEVAPAVSDETVRHIVREMLRSGASPSDFQRIGGLFYRLARNERFRLVTEPQPGAFNVRKK